MCRLNLHRWSRFGETKEIFRKVDDTQGLLQIRTCEDCGQDEYDYIWLD